MKFNLKAFFFIFTVTVFLVHGQVFAISQLSCSNVLRIPQFGLPASSYFLRLQGTFNQDGRLVDQMDLESLMIDFSLSKFEAAEVQAQLRGKNFDEKKFILAIQNVKAGNYFVSEMNVEKIKNAKFVLILDMDETLLDQHSQQNFIPGIHAGSFVDGQNHQKNVAINPGAIELIKKTKSLGAAVVLYSRNINSVVWSSLESIQVEGVALSKLFDGVLTLSHMVVLNQNRFDLRSMNAVDKIMRKDLDLIDNDNVILVDDNPHYVHQKNQLRVVRKFNLSNVQSKSSTVSELQTYMQSFVDDYAKIAVELEVLYLND